MLEKKKGSKLMLFILKDLYSPKMFVIKAEYSTGEKIKDAIYNFRREHPDYNSEMLPDALPEDCELLNIDDTICCNLT